MLIRGQRCRRDRSYHAHRHAALGEVGLGRGNAVFIVMENAGRQGRVGAALGQHLAQVLGTPAPPLATTGMRTASATARVIGRS